MCSAKSTITYKSKIKLSQRIVICLPYAIKFSNINIKQSYINKLTGL